MSDDWEAELNEIENQKENEEDNKNNIKNIESETIIKKVTEPVKNNEPKNDLNDYDKKWEEKNKEINERKMNQSKAVEGLNKLTQQKLIQEANKLNDVADFLGETNLKTENKTLVNEKDFIDFATINASKIKAALKPSLFTFTYLKNSIDLLAPTIDADKIDQLIKTLNFLHNQKRKEESDKNQKKTKGKPTINIGKGSRLEASGALDEFGGMKKKELIEEEEDDDFM